MEIISFLLYKFLWFPEVSLFFYHAISYEIQISEIFLNLCNRQLAWGQTIVLVYKAGVIKVHVNFNNCTRLQTIPQNIQPIE